MLQSPLRIYRRKLPHWRVEGAVYFITWRVASGSPDLTASERDAVASALRHAAGRNYRLHAFVVMNDHVHVLTTPIPPLQVERLVQNWKTYTTREMHRAGRAGPVWQRECFDRIIRSESDYLEKMRYVAGNPWKRWPDLEAYPWVWTEAMEGSAGGPGGPPLPDRSQ